MYYFFNLNIALTFSLLWSKKTFRISLNSAPLLFPRIAILQTFTEFHKTKALNDGVGYIKVK